MTPRNELLILAALFALWLVSLGMWYVGRFFPADYTWSNFARDWGTIIGALTATSAALLTVRILRQQIAQTRQLEDRREALDYSAYLLSQVEYYRRTHIKFVRRVQLMAGFAQIHRHGKKVLFENELERREKGKRKLSEKNKEKLRFAVEEDTRERLLKSLDIIDIDIDPPPELETGKMSTSQRLATMGSYFEIFDIVRKFNTMETIARGLETDFDGLLNEAVAGELAMISMMMDLTYIAGVYAASENLDLVFPKTYEVNVTNYCYENAWFRYLPSVLEIHGVTIVVPGKFKKIEPYIPKSPARPNEVGRTPGISSHVRTSARPC